MVRLNDKDGQVLRVWVNNDARKSSSKEFFKQSEWEEQKKRRQARFLFRNTRKQFEYAPIYTSGCPKEFYEMGIRFRRLRIGISDGKKGFSSVLFSPNGYFVCLFCFNPPFCRNFARCSAFGSGK